MNYYKTSNGERVGKSVVDRRVREAKKVKLQNQLDEFGYNFCEKEGCGQSSGTYLDCSHIESVKSCQENSLTEKAWDVDNIKILCRFHHQIYDGLDLKFSKL